MPTRWVLHVDLDQFVAAVEIRRRPELAGRPVVIGGRGDPTERAVVATASYEAREFGIRSGTPLRTAARRCPDAVFLPADNPAYEAASDEVMAVLRSFPVVVEVMGWDEAFLGVGTDDPEALARDVQHAVAERTGLSCTVGIGDNTLRAKIATEFGKPAGTFRLTRHNWFATMGDRPTTALWGIGTRTARRLSELGHRTVTELAEARPGELAERIGPAMGPYYVQLARGIGREEVSDAPHVARSRSRETTFQTDLDDWALVGEEIAALARRVADDVAAEGRPAVRIGVKLRFAPFLTRGRSATLPAPTSAPEELVTGALAVLDLFEEGHRTRPVRLAGVRAEFPPPCPQQP
ncbi:DNA polymerase IV [Pseudonocardia sp. N23]|uniref:DNA polymerase IV n=1 Tax=Pseudonocardia sp. N23 TaxID=1987376 RepID=UPI000BFDAD1D|nr:DNA polymerase IV [Pseudonocardia sp. N23]